MESPFVDPRPAAMSLNLVGRRVEVGTYDLVALTSELCYDSLTTDEP